MPDPHAALRPRRPVGVTAAITLVVLGALLTRPAAAHQVNTSYTSLVLTGGAGQLVVSIDEADIRLVYPDLDANGDGALWPDEIQPALGRVAAWVTDRIQVRADGEPLVLSSLPPALVPDSDGNLFVRLGYRVAWARPPARLDLDLGRLLQPPLLAEHRNLVKVARPGEREALALLSRAEPVHQIQLGPASPPDLWTQLGRFVWLGIEHIWIGYDHILFLLALIIVGTRLGPLVKIVSAFTVAHSITLVLAALEWVTVPSRLVEAGIALSIAYVAAENFWLRDSRHRWILTFGFGFVHGFGFANVLRDLGLPTEGLVASLLAFNVGVEIGQVAIVAVLFPVILWGARQPFHDLAVRVVSAVILLFGVGWLVERVFDLSFMPL